MSLKLQWQILRSALPPNLKPVALILALVARDDGTGIWVRAETVAGYLGVHRVTVSRALAELARLGIVTVVRRGGRWRTKRQGRSIGKVVGRATERRIDARAIEQFGRSASATWSKDLVATSLHDAADLVAQGYAQTPVRTIKTGTYVRKTGTKRGNTDRKLSSPSAPTPRTIDPISGDDVIDLEDVFDVVAGAAIKTEDER